MSQNPNIDGARSFVVNEYSKFDEWEPVRQSIQWVAIYITFYQSFTLIYISTLYNSHWSKLEIVSSGFEAHVLS